jgi:hypothetical protein
MPWARTGHTYTAYVLGLLVVFQFFLAGYGIAEVGANEDALDLHETIGGILHLLTLVLLVLALFAKYRGALLGMSIFLFVLATLQYVWIDAGEGIVRSLHVVGALAIAMTLREVVKRVTDESKPAPASS